MPKRTNIVTAPTDQTRQSTAIAAGPMEMPRSTTPITLPGVNHERRDGHNRSGTALRGKRKLSEVATQIQYFVVAEPRCIDVRSHAPSQTIEAKSRWVSMECDTRAICSSTSLPSSAFAARRVLKSLQISERDRAGLD